VGFLKPASSWVVVISLVIALVAAATIITARRLADGQRQAVTSLGKINEQAYRLNGIEWKIVASGQIEIADREQVSDARALTEHHLKKLELEPGLQEAFSRVRHALRTYQAATDEEFALLAAGNLQEAKEVDETKVDPSFEELIVVLDSVSDRYNAAAQRSGWLADMTSVIILLLATLVIAHLSRRFERTYQAMLRLETEHAATQDRMERDPLTGLLNRRGLNRYQSLLEPGLPASLLMIDLNDLKVINDRDGHGAGDAQIKQVATALVTAFSAFGAIARWGGDEFVVLLPGIKEERATTMLNEIAQGLEGAFPESLPFSYGLAAITTGEVLERAMAIADAQMYEEKRRSPRSSSESGFDTLEEFTSRLEQLGSPHEIIEVGLSMARRLLGFDASDYSERKGECFVIRSINGEAPAAFESRLGSEYSLGAGITGRAIANAATTWSNDYPNEANALVDWVELGVKSYVAAPVFQGGIVVGVIGMISFRTWRPITPRVRHLLEAVSLRLGHALERVRVLEEIRGTLEGGLLTLGLALEARDLETKGHTERVAHLAESLGMQLGLNDATLETLRQGAYLHDIGKLSVPDSILLKPGKLDTLEWQVMQSHVMLGYEIAARIPSLATDALEVIRGHHERWDGTGYPDQISGEKIPLLARIFAVCDVFDALQSERSYKQAWTRNQALEEIRVQSGKQFDPLVVRAFLESNAALESNTVFESDLITGMPLISKP
jgi:diguanylate cyclase (GGDEF)-like protein/putative nucleotidyltransferase with HDIG domain